jgi:hypothetical protein
MRKQSDTVFLQVRLTEGLRRKLAQLADKDGRSLNAEILWLLGEAIEFFEAKPEVEKELERLEQGLKEMARDRDYLKRLNERVEKLEQLRKGKSE